MPKSNQNNPSQIISNRIDRIKSNQSIAIQSKSHQLKQNQINANQNQSKSKQKSNQTKQTKSNQIKTKPDQNNIQIQNQIMPIQTK